MSPDLVADVGNTRLKWGRCAGGRVVEMASLSPDAPGDWAEQMARWSVPVDSRWLLAGVHPQRRDALREWLAARGAVVQVLDSFKHLPIAVEVDQPAQVGLDRLLNAVAVNAIRQADRPALIVDAGSAITVDWVDAAGVFRGGAISPGLRLMAQALHGYTAKLPLVDVKHITGYPGTSTENAIRSGIVSAAAGGIQRTALHMQSQQPQQFLTGGDAALLAIALGASFQIWPEMTLEGIRLAGLFSPSAPDDASA